MGEAAKASPPAVAWFAGLCWCVDLVGVAAQRCPHVSLLDAVEVHASYPLPLALKSGFSAFPEQIPVRSDEPVQGSIRGAAVPVVESLRPASRARSEAGFKVGENV